MRRVQVRLAVLLAFGGLILGALGLWGVHALYSSGYSVSNTTGNRGGYQELTHFDVASVVWAVALAIFSAVAAGLYPAWRIGRVAPAVYLKSQ